MPVPRLHAVIHIGAHSIRMIVAERQARNDYRVLDHLQVPLLLGQDTFTRSAIGHSLIRDTIQSLRGFQQALASYGNVNTTVIATSAVREATNRETFIDRVQQATGLRIEVIEPMEETRLIHRLVHHLVGDRFGMTKGTTMVLSLGGGGSQIIMFRDGQVVFSESRRVGTVRLRGMLGNDGQMLGEDLDLFVTNVAQTYGLLNDMGIIDTFVVVNNTLHDLLPQFVPVRQHRGAFTAPCKAIRELTARIGELTPMEIQRMLNLGNDDAEMMIVALMQVSAFLGITRSNRVVIPDATFIDAIVIDELIGEKAEDVRQFSMQVESAALHLGRKYRFHEAHALQVRMLAQQLFDQLADFHGMPVRSRLHLGVAALLHDIGWFVSAQSHHKHAAYIINNSEILGLDEEERQVVALVARYHRRSAPRITHPEFAALPPARRSDVLKLASLLRLADGLDRDLSQVVERLRTEVHDDAVLVEVTLPLRAHHAMTVLERAFASKAQLFVETFGTPVKIRFRTR